jgi:hypothetical protein
MAEEDWSSLAGLDEIRRARSQQINGWQPPLAYAVGFREGQRWSFPYTNEPGGSHGLPAVILAEILGYSSGTREIRLTDAQLAEAIASLQPAVPKRQPK